MHRTFCCLSGGRWRCQFVYIITSPTAAEEEAVFLRLGSLAVTKSDFRFLRRAFGQNRDWTFSNNYRLERYQMQFRNLVGPDGAHEVAGEGQP